MSRARLSDNRGEHETARHFAVPSRYSGTPWLKRFCPRTHETVVKGGLEPAILFLTGALLLGWSHPVGSYLMVAALGLGVSVSTTEEVLKARAYDASDALIEQRNALERLRAIRRDRSG